jgi:microsomal epoxide hydrolase
MDLLLDNIMVYWLTGTAGSATWLYRGVSEQKDRGLPTSQRVETPTAFAAFPADLAPPPPREWIERCYNLRQHTPMPRGGHFAALEEPDLLVEDIRAFFRPLRFGAAND